MKIHGLDFNDPATHGAEPWPHHNCESGTCDRRGRWMFAGRIYCGRCVRRVLGISPAED